METGKIRYFLVDGIRGFAVINMAVFHFLYDVFIIYGKNPFWYGLPMIHIWQQMICQSFIFISGFVWRWGMEGNLRRGIRLNLYGFLISFVTWTVIPSEAVWFGILNFMGCAVLLLVPLQKGIREIPSEWGIGICFLLFIFCRRIQDGFIGMGIPVWDMLYSIKILTPLGFPFPGFRSSDYFPIIPWLFLYLCGYFFNDIFRKHDTWQLTAQYKVPFLSLIGSRTIWIYLLHQPISMLVCSLLFG
ncbi:MAG: heparan-alpha-glucosaminide N-acetyltransferase domain-containing protein [Lachnospiraceae bacterium]|nr:heparan-alpha-glucosaminide N-acetyltransferase domain-containing protein [Lachnospiraceae bacterium]